MDPVNPRLESLIRQGASRLMARAGDTYDVKALAVEGRIRKGLEKYVLAYTPDPPIKDVEEFINTLHAEDLCLVLACEAASEAAWSDLVARFNATVRSAARSASGSEDFADDLAQSIWAELHGLRTRDGKPAGKIGYYSGRGSLGGWLRAVVGQLAVDQHRKLSRFVQAEEEDELERLSHDSERHQPLNLLHATELDPESSLAAGRASRAVEAALAESIQALAAEDRLLVKLYYFDGLKLREAGAVLGVHEATASRRLVRVQQEIRKAVEAALKAKHGWSQNEIERSLSEAASYLQSDVESMLNLQNRNEEATQTGS
jgi:RNA polymerase sigma-70 factor (ECF subfamily)